MEHTDGGRALQGSNDDQMGPNTLPVGKRSPGRDTMEGVSIRKQTLLSVQGKRRVGLAARRGEVKVSLEHVRTITGVRVSVVKSTVLYAKCIVTQMGGKKRRMLCLEGDEK